MEDTERMFKPRVSSTGIDERYVTQLRYIPKTLKVFGVYNINQNVRDCDVAPDRVPNVFSGIEET
jgi:hypothetical protein